MVLIALMANKTVTASRGRVKGALMRKLSSRPGSSSQEALLPVRMGRDAARLDTGVADRRVACQGSYEATLLLSK